MISEKTATAINSFFTEKENQTFGFNLCEKCFGKNNLLLCCLCKSYFHIECEGLQEIPIKFMCRKCEIMSKNLICEETTLAKSGPTTKGLETDLNANVSVNVSGNSSAITGFNNRIFSVTQNRSASGNKQLSFSLGAKATSSPFKTTDIQIQSTNYHQENTHRTSSFNQKNESSHFPLEKLNLKTLGDIDFKKTKNFPFSSSTFIGVGSGVDDIDTKKFNAGFAVESPMSPKRLIKQRRKRINNFQDDDLLPKSKSDLFAFENTNPNYRKRKIRVGDKNKNNNYNINVEDLLNQLENDKYYDNNGNHEEDYERNDLKRVYSCSNRLSEREIDEYLKNARFFWEYRNLNVENETSANFFEFLEEFKKSNTNYNKLSVSHKNQIEKKIIQLRKFISFGITLDSHFEEMALKILHISGYKPKLAILFLSQGINPFIDEEAENFNDNVSILQQEILSLISDFYDEDNF